MKPDREEVEEFIPDRIEDHHLIGEWRDNTPPEMDREIFIWETDEEYEETFDP